MRAEPVTRVDGVVVGVREVVIPARDPEPFTGKDGQQRTTKAQPERRYFEAGVNTAAVYDGEVGDVGAVLSVRLPDDVTSHPAKGDRVSWFCQPSIAKAYIRGSFSEWIVHRLVAAVADAKVTLGAPRPMQAAS